MKIKQEIVIFLYVTKLHVFKHKVLSLSRVHFSIISYTFNGSNSVNMDLSQVDKFYASVFHLENMIKYKIG